MNDPQVALESLKAAVAGVGQTVADLTLVNGQLSLQNDSLSAANVSLQAQLDTRDQTIASLQAQLDALQPKPVQTWAQKYGVVGDGKTDDTAALQKAIDAGEGTPPAGTYLINPVRVASGTSFYGLLVGAGKRLEMDPNAVLVLKPNSAPRYCGVRIDGGYMQGGQVLGDRLTHNYSSGGTHEWGYGVQLRGTDSKAVGVKVSQCTGDGFGLSGIRPVIENCISTQNRRQGVSLFGSDGLRISGCEFSNTGALNGQAGTNPRCGVDFEPDAGNPVIKDALIENCVIRDNEVTGLVAWIRSEVVGGSISLTMRNNTITTADPTGAIQPNAVHMKAFVGGISATLSGNTVKRGKGSGLRIETGAALAVDGNTFGQPTVRTNAPQTVTGMSSYTKYDIAFPAQPTGVAPGKASVGTNRYV